MERGNVFHKRKAGYGWESRKGPAENPQITKEKMAEEDGGQLYKEGAKWEEVIVGSKQRDFGKEKAQGKPTGECPAGGRTADEEGGI